MDYHRPLFPERVRQADMLTVCTAISSFLAREGYWPNRDDLQKRLKCHQGALADVVGELTRAHLVARAGTKAGQSRLRLEPRGWETVGLAPLEPYRRPPSLSRIRREAVNAAARSVMREEQAAQRRAMQAV